MHSVTIGMGARRLGICAVGPGEGRESGMADFELMDVTLVSDEFGRRTIPLDEEEDQAVALPAGAVIGTVLTFRTDEAIDGLKFDEERSRDGNVIATFTHVLGGFRAGGPYEIQLPAERLPVGPANCGTYEATGRFVDADGRELARETYRFQIVPQPPRDAPHAPS